MRSQPRGAHCAAESFCDESRLRWQTAAARFRLDSAHGLTPHPPPPARRCRSARAADRLAEAGVPDPSVDAELLAGHVLGIAPRSRPGRRHPRRRDRRRRMPHASTRSSPGARPASRSSTSPAPRRSAISSCASVPGVFVPRPETEMVAQLAIDALAAAASPSPIAVDLGTGSGAIALALATEVPHARVLRGRELGGRVRVDEGELRAGRRRQRAARFRRPRARLPRARRHGLGASSPTRRMFRMPRSRATRRCASSIRPPRCTAARTASTSCAC